MSPVNSFNDEDPLALAIRPPADETPQQREARLAEEAAAKKISDDIDEQIRAESKRRKARAKREIKVLLLEFQLLYAPQSFSAERDSWKSIIYLNLVKSIRKILDAISVEEEGFSDDGDATSTNGKPTSKDALRSGTPISFSPTEDPNSRQSTDDTYAQFAAIKLRLSPLALAEELLIRRLAGPGEEEATQFGSWAPHQASSTSRIKEVFVRSSSNWKRGLFSGGPGSKGKENGAAEAERRSAEKDDPIAIVNACREDMVALWKDASVQSILRRKGVRLEELPGFYLNDINRITSKHYSPSNQDVLNARLKTIGVVEHLFQLESGGEKGVDWRIFDVGGHRDQRQTWAPFFDDVNAIIFLAPISAFDQVLVEDKKVNRIEDSLLLFRSICANKLLGKVNIVLFLNKIDILEKKLKAGVKVSRYVRSYGDRPNEVQQVANYFLTKFIAVHKEATPNPLRELYPHLTKVTDTEATAALISDVREMILRKHLTDSSLM
ncbi:hypothetical protein FRC04_003578 [Tulasnella sp. 424]|nr:hypothetical protein FRC04_003578 [Tulasnella sp. 424]